MPIHKIEVDKEVGGWAVWEITETENQLAQYAHERCPHDIPHEFKRLEWLAARGTVQYLVERMGRKYTGLGKNDFGKPFLTGINWHVSLSHSYPYVAVQISKGNDVGIDLEQPKEKLLRIAPRILSAEELKDAGDDIVKHCVYWCAKETMYKIDGRKGLHFSNQLNVNSFKLQTRGDLQGVITRNEKQLVNLSYQVEKGFVFVYTKF